MCTDDRLSQCREMSSFLKMGQQEYGIWLTILLRVSKGRNVDRGTRNYALRSACGNLEEPILLLHDPSKLT